MAASYYEIYVDIVGILCSGSVFFKKESSKWGILLSVDKRKKGYKNNRLNEKCDM